MIDTLAQVEAARRLRHDAERPNAVARQHALGKMTARERIAELLDSGLFEETGALVEPGRYTANTEGVVAPGDGIVTGFGRIAARLVALAAFDFTIVGGSNGEHGERKLLRVLEQCEQHGLPLVMLLDGGGHRIQEGLDSRHFARGTTIFQHFVDLSGWVPIVAAIMGPGFAGPSNFAALADFVVVVDGTSTMGIAGPALVAAATGENVTKEELGGAKMQAVTAGIADLSARDDHAALKAIRNYLSFLPSNAAELPLVMETNDPFDRRDERLATIVPRNVRRVYDMREVVDGIVDRDIQFELRPTHARNILTILAHIDGHSIGVIANQPMELGGTLTVPACEKAAHFISVCDAFGIPLLFLIDVPGFMVGSAAEKSGLARRSGRLLFEIGRATVPRFSVVLRKGYGLAYIAMAGGRSFAADLAVVWPTAEICAMSIEGAVDVAYRKQLEQAEDRIAARNSLFDHFRAQTGPLKAVEAYGVDDIIDPRDTRKAIALAMRRTTRRKARAEPRRYHAVSPI